MSSLLDFLEEWSVILLYPVAFGLFYLWDIRTWLLNKKIRIKEVIWNRKNEKLKRGQIRIIDSTITVGFLWKNKEFSIDDIVIIGGYSTDDFASETWDEFLILKFINNTEIEINIELDEQMVKWIRIFSLERHIAFDSKEIHHGTREDIKVFYQKSINKLEK